MSHLDKYGIQSVWLSSDGKTSQDILFKMNYKDIPFQIIFVTPEKYKNCKQFQQNLSFLYSRNLLKGFVLDEVHCLRFVFFLLFFVIERRLVLIDL